MRQGKPVARALHITDGSLLSLAGFVEKYVDEQSKREIKELLGTFDRSLLVADPRRSERHPYLDESRNPIIPYNPPPPSSPAFAMPWSAALLESSPGGQSLMFARRIVSPAVHSAPVLSAWKPRRTRKRDNLPWSSLVCCPVPRVLALLGRVCPRRAGDCFQTRLVSTCVPDRLALFPCPSQVRAQEVRW